MGGNDGRTQVSAGCVGVLVSATRGESSCSHNCELTRCPRFAPEFSLGCKFSRISSVQLIWEERWDSYSPFENCMETTPLILNPSGHGHLLFTNPTWTPTRPMFLQTQHITIVLLHQLLDGFSSLQTASGSSFISMCQRKEHFSHFFTLRSTRSTSVNYTVVLFCWYMNSLVLFLTSTVN